MKSILAVLLLATLGLPGGAAHADATVATVATVSTVAPFEPGSLTRIEAAHKGKPFVLILWSLDCPFCQASMKVLSEEKRTRAGLDVVTLATENMDDPQTAALVRERLGAAGLTQGAWAFGGAPPEQLKYAVDPKWHGEMPRSYWYDAQGKRVAHSGVLTPAVVAKLLSR